LLQYYTGKDGRGTVDDISKRLREGCPSYYKESDYKFFLAVEALERAAVTIDDEEKETLAREALNSLSKVPESADLRTVCKRFEDLRYTFFFPSLFPFPCRVSSFVFIAND
jgi:nuclear pore complex protein Nup155